MHSLEALCGGNIEGFLADLNSLRQRVQFPSIRSRPLCQALDFPQELFEAKYHYRTYYLC